MTRYQVTFFKTVINSIGCERRITQRVIPIDAAASCDEAVRCAVEAFTHAEHVPDWRMHADALEVVPA
jgi:hypothetical protein